MNALSQYNIPFRGMGIGTHQLHFEVDTSFFDSFPNDIVNNGKFRINLTLEKKYDHSELIFGVEGTTEVNCDRCLAQIHLPIKNSYTILLKQTDEDVESNDEILFIPTDTSQLDLSKIIFEMIALSIPTIKSYDCESDENPPCDFEVLNKLESDLDQKDDKSGIWGDLKNLSLD